jgi:hypothetical protein
VVKVKVTVRGSDGGLIEEGLAELSSAGGEWRYTTRTAGPSGQTVSVTAVAKDNPGRTGMLDERQCRYPSEPDNFDEFSKSLLYWGAVACRS